MRPARTARLLGGRPDGVARPFGGQAARVAEAHSRQRPGRVERKARSQPPSQVCQGTAGSRPGSAAGGGHRGFEESEGQDAYRAGPEAVRQIDGEVLGDLCRADAPGEPFGHGRGEFGDVRLGEDQPPVDDAQRGEDDDGLRVDVGECLRGCGRAPRPRVGCGRLSPGFGLGLGLCRWWCRRWGCRRGGYRRAGDVVGVRPGADPAAGGAFAAALQEAVLLKLPEGT